MKQPSKRPVTPAVVKKRRKEGRTGAKEDTERGKESRRSDDDEWRERGQAEASYEVSNTYNYMLLLSTTHRMN